MTGEFLHFAFNDEQEMMRDTVRRFLADACPETLVRSVLEGRTAFAAELWRGMAELGLLGITIAEERGGAGMGAVEQCILAEELGRVLAPVPSVSTLYLAPELLRMAGSEEQQAKWLPPIAAGEMVCAIATIDVADNPCVVAGGKLSGQKMLVADAMLADLVIVEADGSLYIVDCRGAEVRAAALEVIDPSRPHGSLTFEQAGAEPLGSAGEGADWLAAARDRAAVYLAFEQIGGAKAALEKASAYALERHAFGRPIGSFQAVKQLLADMFVSLELARANARHACWILASGAPGLQAAAARAHLSASAAFRHCASDTIQVHGGAGFMWETSPHLFYRRSETLARALSGPRVWEKRLVKALEELAA